jgi:hypothetical protein
LSSLETELVNYLEANGFDNLHPMSVPRANTVFPAITFYRESTEHMEAISGNGSAGYCRATIGFDIWSYRYLDIPPVAEQLRLVLQGFHGRWNEFGILEVAITGEADHKEKPGDGSGVWWYSRSVDFDILFTEPLPPSRTDFNSRKGSGGIIVG